jgi:hypothetical protein
MGWCSTLIMHQPDKCAASIVEQQLSIATAHSFELCPNLTRTALAFSDCCFVSFRPLTCPPKAYFHRSPGHDVDGGWLAVILVVRSAMAPLVRIAPDFGPGGSA